MTKLTPVLSASWDQPDSFTIEGYKRNGGYKAVEKALSMAPDEVIQLVKDSGLRLGDSSAIPGVATQTGISFSANTWYSVS